MRDTIKNHKDFIMRDEDPVAKSEYFIVRIKPCTLPNTPRYGVTATKRTFKLAVCRNRAKRLLRDWVRFNENLLLPNVDYIFIARHPILDATRDDGRAAMARALTYLNKNFTTNAE